MNKINNPALLFFSFCFIIYSQSSCYKYLGQQKSKTDQHWLWTVQWQPEGNTLATGGTEGILKIITDSKYKQVSQHLMTGTITDLEWHPTKNILAVAMQGELCVSCIFWPENNQMITLDSLHEFGARAVGWNHSGDLLAIGDYNGDLVIYNEAGQFVKRVRTGQKSIIGLDWHPNQNMIVAVGEWISLYDFQSGEINSVRSRKEDVLMLSTAWHPSGQFFVTGDYGDQEKDHPPLLQFWSKDLVMTKEIKQSKAEYRNISWSGDGENLATASDCLRVWDKKGALIASLKTDQLLWGIDWHRDGDRIAATDAQGEIFVWSKQLTEVHRIKP